jgi:membrane-bound lytic murein transglycosylase D
MPATGRRYGLQVDQYVDERRDPIRATEAAARYLRDLYNIFGSWPLAIAAYNAGENRIIQCILRGKSRDYWTLVSLKTLPRETTDYVPKIIAAATIGANPEKYGFVLPEIALYPEVEAVEVPSPIRLTDLAKISGVPLEDIVAINPHLRGNRTPPNVSNYEVWLPEASVPLIRSTSALASLRRTKGRGNREPAAVTPASAKKNRHRVRPGDNLTLIAQLHGTTVSYLKKVNKLRSETLRPGMVLRITSSSYHPHELIQYRVKRGENLNQISKKFGLTIQELKRENALKSSRIFSGQILKIQKSN